MSSQTPILTYQGNSPAPPHPSIYDAFFSGVLLSIILHIFAGILGGLLAVALLPALDLHSRPLFFLVLVFPIILMFAFSVVVFLRERWLGFLVGGSLSLGAGIFLPVLFIP